MPSIASERFKLHNARQFLESFSEPFPDNYYLFVARNLPWPDDTPPVPEDTLACGTYEYWRDIIAMVRIHPSDVTHAVYAKSWTLNTSYRQYDCDVESEPLFDRTQEPFYVTVDNTQDGKYIFTCIDNGSVEGTPSRSTTEPTLNTFDVTAFTRSLGEPNPYIWKFMYEVPQTDIEKFAVDSYLPVRSADKFQDENGVIIPSGTAPINYDIFNAARLTNNGAIYHIVVGDGGLGYGNSPPLVEIDGDGEGAAAIATVRFGKVGSIAMTSYGRNYSYATVRLVPQGGAVPTQTAETRVILSPRNSYSEGENTYYVSNHGINIEQELGARYVIISTELNREGENSILPQTDSFYRVGIVKNPVLRGTNQLATGNIYSHTTDLIMDILSSTTFISGETITQPSTGASGILVDVVGLRLRLTDVRGVFTNSSILGSTSSAVRNIVGVEYPAIQPYSGDILYVDNTSKIQNSPTVVQKIRIVLAF